MLETMIWNDAFPKSEFKFPWKIIEFITNGYRRPIPKDSFTNLFRIVEKSWTEEPKERLTIDDIVDLFAMEMKSCVQ